MTKRQLYILLLCTLLPWTVGNGLAPLLPVYATQIGATPDLVGYFLSITYVGLAAGTIIAGWLSDKYQRRKATMLVSTVIMIPLVWLLGRTTSVAVLTGLSTTIWFLGGINLTTINIITGLFAEETQRGRIFGIVGLMGPAGAILGGFTMGPIADRWGYSVLFEMVSIFLLLGPLCAVLLKDKIIVQAEQIDSGVNTFSSGLTRGFLFLIFASLLVATTMYLGLLGRSLAMHTIGLSAAAISSTAAIGAMFTIPLPPLIGWLSDRTGRKRFLAICYLVGSFGMFILSVSAAVWHFWIASAFMSVMFYISMSLGSAFVTDLIPRSYLGKGLSIFNSTTWLGGIIGFALAGYTIENYGLLPTFIVGAVMPIFSIVLLTPLYKLAQIKDQGKMKITGFSK